LAEGHVLISGLGIGMILRPLAAKDGVKSITVLELEQDVIDLVAPHYSDLDKLTIIAANAFEWVPDKQYDMAFHDIWPTYGASMLPDFKTLKARYKKHVTHQFFWAERLALRAKRFGY
jgi:spermidine synthase